MTLNFRKLDDTDLKDVFKWKNDKDTVKYSFHHLKMNMREFNTWFGSSLNNKKRKMFLLLDNKKKVGLIFFDKLKDCSEVSIMINPKERGKGYASLALKMVSKYYMDKFKVKRIIAKVNYDNLPSLKCFINAEYNYYGNEMYRLLELKEDTLYNQVK
jgi:RimJ/RimL family protein N-acetyltransferase